MAAAAAAAGALACSFCTAAELQEVEQAEQPLVALIAKAEAALVASRAAAETEKARADAAAISLEQTGSELESKFQSLAEENQRLVAEKVAQSQELKEQLEHTQRAKQSLSTAELQLVERDAELQRLRAESRVLHGDKRSLVERVEQKVAEVQEKDLTMRSYLDKIVALTEEKSTLESQARQAQTEQRRAEGSLAQLQQEKELLEKHNKWLSEELSAKTDTLLSERSTSGEQLLGLKTELAAAQEKTAKLEENATGLRKAATDREEEAAAAQQKTMEVQKAARTQIEQLEEQLTTTTKLSELYKEELEERSSKCVEYQGVLKEMKEQFEQSAAKLDEDIKTLSNEKAALTKELEQVKEELSKTTEEARNARSDVATRPLTSMTTAEGTPIKSLLHVSPTAAAASLMKEGKSLTEIYAEHEKLTEELQGERRERRRLEQFLDDVLLELEQKAPQIRHQQEEYDRMLTAHKSVLAKLQETSEHSRRLASGNSALELQARKDKAEIKNLEAQTSDLAHQVSVLLKEVTDLKGGPAELQAIAPSPGTPGTAGAVISERMVTFKDIQELQNQNQQLRASLRRLADDEEAKRTEYKEQYDRLLAEKSGQLMEELENVKQARERQEAAVESIVRQRDLYLSLLKEAGGATAAGAASAAALLAHTKAPDGIHQPDVALLLKDKEEELNRLRKESEENLKIAKSEGDKYRTDAVQSRGSLATAQAEISFLKSRNETLESGFKERNAQLEDFSRRNAELIGQVSEYQRQIREAATSQSKAQELKRQIEASLSTKELELELSRKSETRLREELKDAYDAKAKSQGLLEGEYAKATLRESQFKSETERLEAEVVKLRTEWATSQQQLEQEKRQNAQLSSAADAQTKATSGSITSMQSNLQKAQEERVQVEARATAAEAKVAELERSLERSDAKIALILQRASSNAVQAEGEGSQADPQNKNEDDLMAALLRAENQAADAKDGEAAAKGHSQQWKAIASAAEEALKQVRDAHETFKQEVSVTSQAANQKIEELQAKLAEVEKESISKEELEKKTTEIAEAAKAEMKMQLHAAEKDAEEARAASAAADTRLDVLKKDIDAAHEHSKAIQANYEREVVLHGEDLKKLKEAESTCSQAQASLATIEAQCKTAETKLEEAVRLHAEEKKNISEALDAAQKKGSDLEEQNKLLHTRLEKLPQNISDTLASDGEQGSIGDLQQVIKYLRREKETAEVKLRLLDQECLRMKLNAEIAQRNADEAQTKLQAETERNRSSTKSEEMHRELMNNIQQLNILKESNATLRSENEQNMKRAKEWYSQTEKLKTEIEPLKKSLTQKEFEIESANAAMNAAKSETETWRARTLQLQDRYKSVDLAKYKVAQTELAKAKAELETAKETVKASDTKFEEEKGKWTTTEAELKANVAKYHSMAKRIHADLLATKKKLAAETEKVTSLEGQGDANAAVAAAKKAGEAELEKEKKRTEQLAKEAGERYKNMRLKAETAMKNMQRAAEEFQKEKKAKELLQKELEVLKGKLQQQDEAKQLVNEAEERRKLLAAKAAARKAGSERAEEASPAAKRAKLAEAASAQPKDAPAPVETPAEPTPVETPTQPEQEAMEVEEGEAKVEEVVLKEQEEAAPVEETAVEPLPEATESPAATDIAPPVEEAKVAEDAVEPEVIATPTAAATTTAATTATAVKEPESASEASELDALRAAALSSTTAKKEIQAGEPAAATPAVEPVAEDVKPLETVEVEPISETPTVETEAVEPTPSKASGLSAEAPAFTPTSSGTKAGQVKSLSAGTTKAADVAKETASGAATSSVAGAAATGAKKALSKDSIAQQMKAKAAELERLRAIIMDRETAKASSAPGAKKLAEPDTTATPATTAEGTRKRARTEETEAAPSTEQVAAASQPTTEEATATEGAAKKMKVEERVEVSETVAEELTEEMKLDLKPLEDLNADAPQDLDLVMQGQEAAALPAETIVLDSKTAEVKPDAAAAATAATTSATAGSDAQAAPPAQKARMINLRGTGAATTSVPAKPITTPTSGSKPVRATGTPTSTGAKPKTLNRQGSKGTAVSPGAAAKAQAKVSKAGVRTKAVAAAAEAAAAAAATTTTQGAQPQGRGRGKATRGKAVRGKARGRGRGQGGAGSNNPFNALQEE